MEFEQAWLDYTKKAFCKGTEDIKYICVKTRGEEQDELIKNGILELQRAFAGILGIELTVCQNLGEGHGICLTLTEGIQTEAYHVYENKGEITIEASDSKGILYGAFELIRQVRIGNPLGGLDLFKAPKMPMRMLNHWDNMDGSIERLTDLLPLCIL